ncbi:HEAT repeat domain-containing protein [Urbifossiella limnaea]|uniref:HEAT repeat domain-containing protein n=1 Tax=Urbifossiella limnaea TaxID=2528023 RepID=UPI0011A91871|nr:HEAT repeat domain-containing protein [Urbifossiella limnaea]
MLIHGPRKLVLTNYHVVETAGEATVFFPVNDGKGDLITDLAHYTANAAKLRVTAKVIARDAGRDLAVLELDRVPAEAFGLPLAGQPAATGAAVYSIGGSGAGAREGGALWRFSVGAVRGRSRKTFRFPDGQVIAAMILETQKPVNPGDSGGPTANDRGELVGVVSMFDRSQNLVVNDIDLTEVRAYLTKVAKDGGWAWKDSDAAPPSGLAPRPVDPASPPPPDTKAVLLADTKSSDAAKRVEAFGRLGEQKAAARWAVPLLVAGLDDVDDRARRMAAVALEQIGPPAPEDAGCLAAALAGDKRYARLHALRHFGTVEKAGRDLLSAVVAALDAPDAETREAAAQAVGFYGPDARTPALPKLFNRAADPDPAVARAVGRVLISLAPYAGADRAPLMAALNGTDPVRRYTALRLLTAGANDAESVVELVRPRLADPSAPVRELAARAAGGFGPAARAAAPELVYLVADQEGGVRAAAVWALGEMGGAPGAVAAIGRLLAADDPLVRSAAALSLVRIGVTDPADGPILRALIANDDAAIRAAALENAARVRPLAPDLITAAADVLPAADPAVRLAALRVLTAAGPEAARHSAKAFEALAAGPPPAPPAPPPPPTTGDQLVERVTRSATWVLADRYGDGVGSGSGTLIDGPNRLVLTNYHVVEGGGTFRVEFPTKNGHGVKGYWGCDAS